MPLIIKIDVVNLSKLQRKKKSPLISINRFGNMYDYEKLQTITFTHNLTKTKCVWCFHFIKMYGFESIRFKQKICANQ